MTVKILLGILGAIVILSIIANRKGQKIYENICRKLIHSGALTGRCHICGNRADVPRTIAAYYIDMNLNNGRDVDMKLFCISCGNAKADNAVPILGAGRVNMIGKNAMRNSLRFHRERFIPHSHISFDDKWLS